MIIGSPSETRSGETRVAATPETIKKLLAGGKHVVLVQSGAGQAASIPNADYQGAGASIAANAAGRAEFAGAEGFVMAELRDAKGLVHAVTNPIFID